MRSLTSTRRRRVRTGESSDLIFFAGFSSAKGEGETEEAEELKKSSRFTWLALASYLRLLVRMSSSIGTPVCRVACTCTIYHDYLIFGCDETIQHTNWTKLSARCACQLWSWSDTNSHASFTCWKQSNATAIFCLFWISKKYNSFDWCVRLTYQHFRCSKLEVIFHKVIAANILFFYR